MTTVDQCHRTALHYCATNRQTLVVDLLLRHWLQTGADARSLLEIGDSDGLTALAHAVIVDNHTIVQHLLLLGADVSCHDNERHTVMHFATGNISQLQYGSVCHNVMDIISFCELFSFIYKIITCFAELSSLSSSTTNIFHSLLTYLLTMCDLQRYRNN